MMLTEGIETAVPSQPLLDPPKRKLSGADRCDSCQAAAYGIATKGTKELYFCGHHFNKRKGKLAELGWELHDETDAILASDI